MADTKDAKKPRSSRQRSPKYPAFSLDIAMQKLKVLWDKDGKVGSLKNVALGHMGYTSAKSSSSLRAIATMRGFGLTEEKNGRILPSQNALDLLLYSASDEKHKRALREAALKPNIFRELYSKYSEGLPSDEALKAELIKEYNYNPKSVAELLSTFRDTLKIAGLLDKPKGENEQEENDNQETDDLLKGNLTKMEKELPGVSPPKDKEFVKVWSLTGGAIAKLQVTQPPVTKDKAFLKMCLERALEELFPDEPKETT